jgi:hypothetical protein
MESKLSVRVHLGLLTPLTAVVLSGCGGSGSGGSSATLSPFTSWSSIQRSTSVTVEGVSQSGNYTWDSGTDLITSRTAGAAADGASYSGSYDSNGDLTAVTLTPSGGASISWDSNAGDLIGSASAGGIAFDGAISANSTNYALAANPFNPSNGWDYQSFGIWVTGAGTGSGAYGAMSVGSMTPGSSIPTSGSALFSGTSGGRYVNALGQYYFTVSNMSASVDFSSRTVLFSTFGTQVSPDLLFFNPDGNLDMSGLLSYSAATNQITGQVDALAAGLSGSVNGRFYGPVAQEIGGTFALENPLSPPGSVEGYVGAFGGKQ